MGDGIAIFAFLLFMCGWLGGWLLIPNLADDVAPTGEDVSFWDGVGFLMLLAVPCLWAGGCIERILKKS